MRLKSLELRLALWLALAALMGALVYIGVTQWPLPQVLAWMHSELPVHVAKPSRGGAVLICVLVLAPLSWWFAHIVMEPVTRLLRALEGAVASYRDGDFSISIALNRHDELGDLVRVHNQLGQTLREQRQNLAQRELLLDTVVQNTTSPRATCSTKGAASTACTSPISSPIRRKPCARRRKVRKTHFSAWKWMAARKRSICRSVRSACKGVRTDCSCSGA